MASRLRFSVAGFSAAAAVSATFALSAAWAQSPVVQPQYFGAPVSPVVAVELNGAASQPLGQSAFAGGQGSSGTAHYGQRVQAESSPQMYTGVSGVSGFSGSGVARSVRP
jgi:hypothetical protein